ncbi:MAG TPA: hypothetical protein VI306_26165 [Pyrinomonadaceae bacterium]
MRKILTLVTLCFIALLITIPSTGQQSPARQAALALRSEAQQQAERFWFARMTKCGDDYFTKERIFVHQFKSPQVVVGNSNINSADRQNGVEWSGPTSLVVAQVRTFSNQNQRWSAWSQDLASTLGGVGLSAQIVKEKGRWRITPTMISQAGSLQPISCSEAANPAESYKQSQRQAYSAAVRKYKEQAASMGIFAHNLPEEIWPALYRRGGVPNALYTTVSSVFLAGTGGWQVCGRNGCESSKLLPLPGPGWRFEQVTEKGSYLFLNGGQQWAVYPDASISQDLLNQLTEYHKQGVTIKLVRIGFDGGWFVLGTGGKTCAWCNPPLDRWSWQDVPMTAEIYFTAIWNNYQAHPYDGGKIKDVAFAPNGGYVILYGNSEYYAEGIPAEAASVLASLRAANKEINQVAFGPNGSWIIRANGWW